MYARVSRRWRQVNKRCIYSWHGIKTLKPRHPHRLGMIVAECPEGAVRVLWDGTKHASTYGATFIQMVPEPVCTIDMSRAPILRELLGLRP